MRPVICLGDPTSHGGRVVAVSASHYKVDGRPVARVGDRCACPIKGHDGCTIVEGDVTFTIDGIPVALHGHKTSCGAELLATVPHFAGV
ncbi:hypothetical protein GO613_16820 [Azoarcus communis]|uniref:PAAR domain-containing protein n=1 Tax=Parazoarcus communis TaxID=41977 RepID=UPI00145979B7|nr:PAAR domain-containing protein [Parazoarcus communis]NMG49764.1 hypothetical protein [Parazoarcus communis]